MSEIEMHADFLFVSYPERIFEFDFKMISKTIFGSKLNGWVENWKL